MNSKERLDCAIALEIPDRVPVGPLLDHFAAAYTGTTMAAFMNDADARISALVETVKDLGPWDVCYAAETATSSLLKLGIPARARFPGVDLPENVPHQFDEREVMTPEDYDLLIEEGAEPYLSALQERLYPELTGSGLGAELASVIPDLVRSREQLEAAGAQSAIGGFAQLPFEHFGFARGLLSLSLDVYDRPEKIVAASAVLREALTGRGVAMARAVGVPRVFIGLGRAGPATISLEHWEELVWPSLDYIVATLLADGMTPILHCDTDWTRAFPALRRLPPGKCILELDGHSDIFEAKKVVGDRMCIMGDVPATLLAFGEKDEVMTYCRRLIETVGRGGGFILSSGCSIPANARPENVKALAEAVEQWGRY
jgi:hypothetical protein